jgi:N-carbamoyl-L-amino-acid hydrolase
MLPSAGSDEDRAVGIRDAAKRAAAAVDQERLWRRHMAMAEIGKIPGGGVSRQALSGDDARARALLLEWAATRGYLPAVDAIANLFVRRPGRDPDAAPVVAGSHMDSQPAGGRFDGIFGVLAGLVRLDDCLAIADAAGVTFGDALCETLAATPELLRRRFGFPIAAYVEPHIEQGPQLEASGHQIGVVTGIQGARWYVVEVDGEPAHAGTSPLAGRKDAVRAAVAMIGALQELMHDETDQLRFTVGRIEVFPNSPNTVPAKVTFSIDFRHPEAALLDARGGRIEETCRRCAGPCEVRLRETFNRPPCAFPRQIVDTIEGAAQALGLAHMRLPSGAFHDANFVADVAPTGMIFVPCERGISHSPAENALPEDLAAGARVLAATLVELAGSPA